MKQDMEFDDLKKLFQQHEKQNTNYVSMEEAMANESMHKMLKKQQQKVKRQHCLEIALVLLILVVTVPILFWYLYDKYRLFRQLPELLQFFIEQPVLATVGLACGGGFVKSICKIIPIFKDMTTFSRVSMQYVLLY